MSFFFFSSRRRHTSSKRDWSSDVCSSDLLFDPLSPAYYFFGLSLIVLSLEAARRTVGLGLTAVVGVFIAYNLYGHLLKGFMSHGYISLEHFIDITVFTSDGLFSVPIQVTVTYAFLFVF